MSYLKNIGLDQFRWLYVETEDKQAANTDMFSSKINMNWVDLSKNRVTTQKFEEVRLKIRWKPKIVERTGQIWVNNDQTPKVWGSRAIASKM